MKVWHSCLIKPGQMFCSGSYCRLLVFCSVCARISSYEPFPYLIKGVLVVSVCFEVVLLKLGFCTVFEFCGLDFERSVPGRSSMRHFHGILKGFMMIGEGKKGKSERVEVT